MPVNCGLTNGSPYPTAFITNREPPRQEGLGYVTSDRGDPSGRLSQMTIFGEQVVALWPDLRDQAEDAAIGVLEEGEPLFGAVRVAEDHVGSVGEFGASLS